MSSRERQYELQRNWLAECLAIALALEIRGEVVADEYDQLELSDLARDAQNMILDPGAHYTARREQLKSTVEYQRAVLRIKSALTKHLRNGEQAHAASGEDRREST